MAVVFTGSGVDGPISIAGVPTGTVFEIFVATPGHHDGSSWPITASTDVASPDPLLIKQQYVDDGGTTNTQGYVYTYVWDGVATQITFSVLFESSCVQIIGHSGIDTTTPYEASSGTAGSSASIAIPTLTTTAASSIVGWFGVTDGGFSGNPTDGTNTWTTDIDPSTTNILGRACGGFDRVQPTAGATGTVSAALTGSNDWCGAMVALKPAVTGPTINTQPSNASSVVQGTATFTVSATASAGSLTYQWKLNGSNVSGGSGGTSASYTTPALNIGDNGGLYTCAVTDSNGTTTTTAAILTTFWNVTGVLSDDSIGEYAIGEEPVAAGGSTAYTRTISFGASSTVATTKQVNAIRTWTALAALTVVRSIGSARSFGGTATPAIVRSIGAVRSFSATGALVAIETKVKLLAVSFTASASLATSKVIGATRGFSGASLLATQKTVGAIRTFAALATFQIIRTLLRVVGFGASAALAISKQVKAPRAFVSTGALTLSKQANAVRGFTAFGALSISKQVGAIRSFAPSAALVATAGRIFLRTFSFATSGALALTKQVVALRTFTASTSLVVTKRINAARSFGSSAVLTITKQIGAVRTFVSATALVNTSIKVKLVVVSFAASTALGITNRFLIARSFVGGAAASIAKQILAIRSFTTNGASSTGINKFKFVVISFASSTALAIQKSKWLTLLFTTTVSFAATKRVSITRSMPASASLGVTRLFAIVRAFSASALLTALHNVLSPVASGISSSVSVVPLYVGTADQSAQQLTQQPGVTVVHESDILPVFTGTAKTKKV